MPKRRAPLSEVSPNDIPRASAPRNAKKTKTKANTSVTRSGAEYKPQPSLPSPKPKHKLKSIEYANLQWPNFDPDDEENQDIPAEGEILSGWYDRVSDLGFPVSEAASGLQDKLSDEVEKRDQDIRDLFIYNDWNGWGIAEVMENFVREFDAVLSRDARKVETAVEEWKYVEALACYLKDEWDAWAFVSNENSTQVTSIVDMFGVMILTSLTALSSHNLFKPNSEIKNIPIICLIFLEFLKGPAQDLEIEWGCEVVRLCDENGIDLAQSVRKQVAVSVEDLEGMRKVYGAKRERGGYEAAAGKKDWKPEDDLEDGKDEDGWEWRRRGWYRWDWGVEHKLFSEEYPGGSHYDLTKKSKAYLKKHAL